MFRNLLRCPNCRHELIDNPRYLLCSNCRVKFPIVDGIPVLLPSHSIFSIEQVAAAKQTFYATKAAENTIKSRFRKSLPRLTGSREKEDLRQNMNRLVGALAGPVKGLQVGAGETPESINATLPQVQWLNSDVDLSYKPHVIADVTGLPVADASFDIVYANRVLAHVFDIGKAASELQRVLKVGGLLIVGIPFMYPFHGIPYDFYRVTPSGIRALFAHTECVQISRGSGAWSALALQMDARVVNAFKRRQARWVASVISRFLFGGLKYLDSLGDKKRNMISCASLIYIGRKREGEFTPREIMDELRSTVI